LLKNERAEKHGRLYMASEKFFDWVLSLYRDSLHWVLEHPLPTIIVLVITIALNVVLIYKYPQGIISG
jgi:multidrug efflux pump